MNCTVNYEISDLFVSLQPSEVPGEVVLTNKYREFWSIDHTSISLKCSELGKWFVKIGFLKHIQ